MSAIAPQILQSGATGTGNGNVANVAVYNTVGLGVSGTFSATITVEGSVDGTNFSTLQVTNTADGSTATSITATGIYRVTVSGINFIRARISGYVSGSVTVNSIATEGGGSGAGGGGGTGSNASQVQGNIAHDGADSGNPVKVGGKYNATPPTVVDGDRSDLQTDANGNLKTTEATLFAGEDLTVGVLKTEQRYSYSAVATADVQVKSGAGFLHSVTITCNDAAPTAGSLIIYDNTAESGTQVFNHTFTTTPFNPLTVILDYTMGTGIYLGFTTTNDVNVSVAYR